MANPIKRFLSCVIRRRKRVPVIPVVRLQGVIAAQTSSIRPGLSLSGCASQLEKAFGNKKAPAVAIVINSPGGSPVQSHLVFRRIRDLSEENSKRVLVFVEDVAASGGYMIACAGDEIYADQSSIVGSIGVVSSSFGFPELLRKIGVERRVYTAGKNKVSLDPFQPEKEEDIQYLKSLQLEIHEAFINLVKERRGERLKDDDEIFTGKFWTGGKSKTLGLVDDLGDVRSVLRARYGEDVRLKLIPSARKFPGLGSPGGGISGAEIVDATAYLAEERFLFARYGR